MKHLRRRDGVTASLLALSFPVLLPFKWTPIDPGPLEMPHAALYGFPLPFTWWSMVSSLEYVLSPVPWAIDTVLWAAIFAAVLGLGRGVFRPRIQLTRLSLAVLWATLLLPALPFVLVQLQWLTWTIWPVAATPTGFVLEMTYY